MSNSALQCERPIDSPSIPEFAVEPAAAQTEATECCTWCGLPVPHPFGKPSTAPSPNQEDIYCCFGCRIAHAITEERGQTGIAQRTVVRLGLAVFFTMNLMAFTMVSWSPDIYGDIPGVSANRLLEVFRWLSMLFSLPVLLLLGLPLLHSAVIGLRQRLFSTDLLIAVGVIAAYVVSVCNVVLGSGAVYFEVGAAVLVLVTVGRWFEAVGRQKATESLDELSALLPVTARRTSGSLIEEVASNSVAVGDQLQVRPGERFPTDGRVVHGHTSVDEQIFNGESTPIARTSGDPILAGTVNLDGLVTVEVTAIFRGGSFGRLLHLLQQARLSRGHYQLLADRIAAWFLPFVVGLSIATFFWHRPSGIGLAIQHGLSVLLIACPCALGLATPLAVWTALSTAIRRQVLFRSGEAIERLAEVKAVCFDKTGTLTTGSPQVQRVCLLSSQPEANVLSIAASLAQSSTHPFSQAVCRYASRELTTGDVQLSDVSFTPGHGVQAFFGDGRSVRLGSVEYAFATAKFSPSRRMQLAQVLSKADQDAMSLVAMSVGNDPVALFMIAETLRADAAHVIRECGELGLVLAVLTGDRASRAEQLRGALLASESGNANHLQKRESVWLKEHSQTEPVAGALRLMKTSLQAAESVPLIVECELQPHEKVERLLQLRDRFGSVAMVGDGINDAPALAASNAGIAMGCGADVSRESAQVCLLTSELNRIPWAIQLARRTRNVIRQNLMWAFGYNFIGVAFAAAGLLNPVIAAALMIISSLLVISNSLRLLRDDAVDDETSHAVEGSRS